MNQEKLAKLQQLAADARIGGKGTARRKKKVVHKSGPVDEKKVQATLKKLGANSLVGIEEANFFQTDNKILHFVNPKVQASMASNFFSISGNGEVKEVTELLPGILQQLSPTNLEGLKKYAEALGAVPPGAAAADDDDVPDLVESFEDASKK
eukprot:m.219787 g.219787  ORF g.219787 m.219787 type:complete len:152 (+) comp10249_c0_seq1:18-473(+)